VGVVVGKEMGRVVARAEIVAVVVVVPVGFGVGWGSAARRDRVLGMEVMLKVAWMRVVGRVSLPDPVGVVVVLKGIVPLKEVVPLNGAVPLKGLLPWKGFSPEVPPVKLARPAPKASGPLLAVVLILGPPEGCLPPGLVMLNLGLLEEKIGKKGAMLTSVDVETVSGTANQVVLVCSSVRLSIWSQCPALRVLGYGR
jgi:hypothetical protein